MIWEERMGRALYVAHQMVFAEEKYAGPAWDEMPEDRRRAWGRIARLVIEKANSEDNPRESRMK